MYIVPAVYSLAMNYFWTQINSDLTGQSYTFSIIIAW